MNSESSGGAKVAEYYESVENRLWAAVTRGYIHLGYWDETNRDASFADGTLRLTKVMIDRTAIEEGQRFCDIGCGIGMPAILLAKTKGCYVDGITISPYQRDEAARRAAMEGVDGKTTFWTADALKLPFAERSFDGGWFFESIFHMGHRPALQEAHRVLKPNAELAIADVVDIGIMTDEDKRRAKEICNASYISTESYPDLLDETGFECIEVRDVTKEVMGSFEEKYIKALRDRREELLDIASADVLDGFETLAGQLVQTAGYAIIRARRI